MRKLLFIALLGFLVVGKSARAQSYEVPKDYTLKTKEDYTKYEQDVINTVDWLQQTSWDEQQDKRKEASAFLIAWLTGSSTVTITIQAPLAKMCDKNPDLLIIFMGGFTKYALQHKDAQNANAANVAGFRALIAKYQMEKNHKKQSAVEKLIKIDQDGKLEEWTATDYVK